jgi:hypothetical protein
MMLGGAGCSFLPEPDFTAFQEDRPSVMHEDPMAMVTKPMTEPGITALLEQLQPGETRPLPPVGGTGSGSRFTLLEKYASASGETCCIYRVSHLPSPGLACKTANGCWIQGRYFLPAIVQR